MTQQGTFLLYSSWPKSAYFWLEYLCMIVVVSSVMNGMNGLGRSCAITAFRRQTLSASNCCCENPHLIPRNVLHLWRIFQLLFYLPHPWKWMFPARLCEFLFSMLCCPPRSQSCLTLAFESPVSEAFSAFRDFEDFPGNPQLACTGMALAGLLLW